VASGSLGNYFFNEIRDLIASGLRELGCHVVVQSESTGLNSDVDLQIIVAPHEFFFLGEGERLRLESWPDNVILVTTEQPSTEWFARARECLHKARAVWDIDFNTTRHLRRMGIACDYLPLGYEPNHDDLNQVARLAQHYGSCFLDEEIKGTASARGPLATRPLDLVFIGGMTRRRELFFTRAAPVLADFNSYIHINGSKSPVIPGKTSYFDTAAAVGLSQRSKILLNIHRGNDVYFEWHRIVMHGLWQKTLVVSEVCSDAPPFKAGVDYVEATLDELPRTLHYYLRTPRGQREAQEIAENGHRTLVEECRLSRFLNALLSHHAQAGAVLSHFESNQGSPIARLLP
jgi:hypothetical protein